MGWRRKQKNRTENGPRYENRNPGAGCNATHVARARRAWQTLFRRKERRTDGPLPTTVHGRAKRRGAPSVHDGINDYDDEEQNE